MFEHEVVTINSHGEITAKGNLDPFLENIRQQIMDAEDREIFKILDSIAASGNKDI